MSDEMITAIKTLEESIATATHAVDGSEVVPDSGGGHVRAGRRTGRTAARRIAPDHRDRHQRHAHKGGSHPESREKSHCPGSPVAQTSRDGRDLTHHSRF